MEERFKNVVCTDLLARKVVDGKTLILLSKRKNTVIMMVSMNFLEVI